jgi:hypothetical protein
VILSEIVETAGLSEVVNKRVLVNDVQPETDWPDDVRY